MARSCAICGKASMGGFNPQSSGMNRVRAHRRMQPNLQPLDRLGGEASDAVRTQRCRAHDVDDGPAGDERSTGGRLGRHAGNVLLA